MILENVHNLYYADMHVMHVESYQGGAELSAENLSPPDSARSFCRQPHGVF